MKTMNLTMTAAAAILMTGAAMAQGPMTANVPFGFQFGGVNLPAGEYRVDTSRSSIAGLVLIQNQQTNQSAIRIGVPHSSDTLTDYRPRLVFRCGEAGCVLNQVWSPAGAAEFVLPKGAKLQYTSSIPLNSTKAD